VNDGNEHEQLATLLRQTTSTEKNASLSLNWTNRFKQIIKQRLNNFHGNSSAKINNNDIRFNLMAVVPDQMCVLREQIQLWQANESTLNHVIAKIKEKSNNTNTFRNVGQLEFVFDLAGNDLVGDLLANANLRPKLKLNRRKLVTALDKQFDAQHMCKLFKIVRVFTVTTFSTFTTDEMKEKEEEEEEENGKNETKRTLLIGDADNNDTNNNDNDDNDQSVLLKSITKKVTISNDKNDEEDKSELKAIAVALRSEVDAGDLRYQDETKKREKYKVEALRRKHVYDEFILTYLQLLAESGKLAEIVKTNLTESQTQTHTTTNSSPHLDSSNPNNKSPDTNTNTSHKRKQPGASFGSMFLPGVSSSSSSSSSSKRARKK